MQKWHERDFPERKSLECLDFENATILPVKRIEDEPLQFGHGGVINSKGEYVVSSGIKGRIGGSYPISKYERSEETVVYLGYFVRQWGHFLIEGSARLWYFLTNPQNIDKYVFVSTVGGPTEIAGNYREFLELLGIIDRVEIINQPVRYRRVLVPELSYSRTHYYSIQYRQVFDHIIEKALAKPWTQHFANRVFLSRSRFVKAKQTEAGLELLDDFFHKNGFTIVFPEQLKLAELIQCLQQAEICAAESGTLPHNFLFAQQQKECIIIERQAVPNEIQANIDIIKQLNTTYVDGQFTIYPVFAGFGPFFFTFNQWFKRFAEERNCTAPDKRFRDNRYLRKSLRHYMSTYKKAYGFNWGLEQWMLMYSEVIYEAYEDSRLDLDEYLSGRKPFSVKQLLSFRMMKQQVKSALRNTGK